MADRYPGSLHEGPLMIAHDAWHTTEFNNIGYSEFTLTWGQFIDHFKNISHQSARRYGPDLYFPQGWWTTWDE
mgnify:CR=1 FL=1